MGPGGCPTPMKDEAEQGAPSDRSMISFQILSRSGE
jgi:hypothetical protein